MNWKDYTTMTALALAILTAGLLALWQAQSRQSEQALTGNPRVAQTANTRVPTPLAAPVDTAPERTEDTSQKLITRPLVTPSAISLSPDTPETAAIQPIAQERTVPDSSTRLVIDATPIPMLPAALQARFPSARTIEPVEITSLPDQLALRGGPTAPLQRLQLPAPQGRTVDVVVQQHKKIHARRGTITGTVAGIAHSEVIISYAEEAMTASVIIPGSENMEIAYAGNGCHVLLDIDPAKILPNAPPLIPAIEVAKVTRP